MLQLSGLIVVLQDGRLEDELPFSVFLIGERLLRLGAGLVEQRALHLGANHRGN